MHLRKRFLKAVHFKPPIMTFKATHIIKKTGEKVELYDPFPNDLGTVCVLQNNDGPYCGHLMVYPEELEVIK